MDKLKDYVGFGVLLIGSYLDEKRIEYKDKIDSLKNMFTRKNKYWAMDDHELMDREIEKERNESVFI